MQALLVQPAIHSGRVRELDRVDVELPHACPIEPIDDHDIEGITAAAIAVSDPEHLLLTFVACLALDVAKGRLRRQRCNACEPAVTGVDLICVGAGDDEVRHALAHVRAPDGMSVQPRRHLGGRRVVPDHAVASVGHEERDADCLTGRRVVVVPAINRPPAKVEDALLILAEPIIVLVSRSDEIRADTKRLLAIHCVRRHLPTTHFEQRGAPGVTDSELYRRQRCSEVALALSRRSGPWLNRHLQRQPV